jgi:RNA recognition motif-containing protein
MCEMIGSLTGTVNITHKVKLLVRNIARLMTQQELLSLFERYGKVQYCTLIVDKESGNHKGFGFVEMPKPGEVKAAIKNLNGKELKSMKLRVKKAEPNPRSNPGSGYEDTLDPDS